MKRARRSMMAAVLLLAGAGAFFAAGSAEDWARALAPRTWTFPADHGAHPSYRTEWWYFTGTLAAPDGRLFGYQLTFFRQGLRYTVEEPRGAWALRDAAMAHFTITDAAAKTFGGRDLLTRTGPGLAGWSESTLNVHVLNWSARLVDGRIVLRASKGGLALDLELRPRKPPVPHGRGGLSRKGQAEGEASYYASWTDLESAGTITPGPGSAAVSVRGRSWFDHEFGSGMLAPGLTGWDWFSLHLSDGRDLMIYRLRREDGSIEPASSGTLIEIDGRGRGLALAEIEVEVLDRWKSPHSGGRYPSRWRIRLPGRDLDLEIAPLLPDQEVRPEAMPVLVYWEGAVAGRGRFQGRPVKVEGYVELTGYAGDLRRVF
jgi:predicted secreted hydrolase